MVQHALTIWYVHGYVLIVVMTDYSTQNIALVRGHSFKASHEHKLDYTENGLMNIVLASYNYVIEKPVFELAT